MKPPEKYPSDFDLIVQTPIRMILQYEIVRATWVSRVRWKWAQALAAKIMARRAKKIAARFRAAAIRKALVDSLLNRRK